LSVIEQLLTAKQRQDIESHLANYNIPLQILQMVAEQCECVIDTKVTGRELSRKPKLPLLLSRLNDKAIVLLQQIFLDCHDSFSNFRFTVFLSSKYSAMTYKFVMDGKVAGKSKLEHQLDVCIYSRQTGELVAIGMQNKEQQASDSKSLSGFLNAVDDICGAHSSMQGAYYASSYGYEGDCQQARKNSKKKDKEDGAKVEIRFFEYKDKIYFESKSLSR
jgi:hypothetical protein